LGGYLARLGTTRNAYRYIILVRRSEGRRTFGRPRDILEDNIKMGLEHKGCEVVDWRAVIAQSV
jgi:hypothetical protein